MKNPDNVRAALALVVIAALRRTADKLEAGDYRFVEGHVVLGSIGELSFVKAKFIPLHPDLRELPGESLEVLTLEVAERRAISKALNAANGNVTKAAGILGIGKTTLYRKLKDMPKELPPVKENS